MYTTLVYNNKLFVCCQEFWACYCSFLACFCQNHPPNCSTRSSYFDLYHLNICIYLHYWTTGILYRVKISCSSFTSRVLQAHAVGPIQSICWEYDFKIFRKLIPELATIMIGLPISMFLNRLWKSGKRNSFEF